MKNILFFTILFLTAYTSKAQLNTNNTMTPTQLVQNVLLGSGVTVSNVSYTGHIEAMGQFSGGAGNIGIPSGVIMTTGSILQGIRSSPFNTNNGLMTLTTQIGPAGPNDVEDGGWHNSQPGDADLETLAGGGVSSFNAAVLEFDFVPTGNSISFKYVFASEEYIEYVGTGFNDVFAFWISGPGISGTQNLAVVPSTTTPVSINTINQLTNSTLYINNPVNSGNVDIQYDGLTTVLTATTSVTCGNTYHIKIAIADIGDGVLDSGVFLEANSLNSPELAVSMPSNATITCLTNSSIDITPTVTGGMPNYGYTWSSGETSSSITVSPAVTTTYDVVVNDFCGFTINESITITVDTTSPLVNAGSDLTTTCNQPSVLLNGNSNGNYTWSPSLGLSNTTILTPTASPTSSTDYTLTATNPSNGCTSSDVVTVTVSQNLPTADAGLDQVIDCNIDNVILDGSNSSNGSEFSYVWSTNGGSFIGSTTNNIVNSNQDGIYILTVTNSSNGCSSIDTVLISIDTISPTITLPNSLTLDCNSSQLTINGSNSTGIGNSYNWTTQNGNIVSGENTTTPLINSEGEYILNIQSANGCTTNTSITVSALQPPIAQINATPTEGEATLDVSFGNNSTGSNLTYSWDLMTSLSNLETPNNSYDTVGSYTIILTVTDDNGCSDSDTIVITVNDFSETIIPNIFTPNNDGLNDVFNVSGDIETLTGAIFNRWGQQIYYWNTIKGGWDGYTNGGIKASEGTYYYILNIKFRDQSTKKYTGPFTLKR